MKKFSKRHKAIQCSAVHFTYAMTPNGYRTHFVVGAWLRWEESLVLRVEGGDTHWMPTNIMKVLGLPNAPAYPS